MSNPVITSCVVLFVFAVAIIDASTRKIPNVLTVSAALAALLMHGVMGGLSGALVASAGLLVGLAVFLPLFLTGGYGAGDVKAMAAIGAFLGPKVVLLAAAFTLIAGAVAGFAWLLALGGLPALRNFARRWALRIFAYRAAQIVPNVSVASEDPASRRFPYGVAIACGTLVSLAWS